MSLAASEAAQSSRPIPKLAEPFEPTGSDGGMVFDGDDRKFKKRGLFRFGKKKGEEAATRSTPKSGPGCNTTIPSQRTSTSLASAIDTMTHTLPASPGRGLSSPAGSQIFERDVQESTPIPNSPAIPSHIQTENFIPPVLDASSEAITDDHLDPDSVEIVTHTSHQPASVTVTGISAVAASTVGSDGPHWADELAAFAERNAFDGAVGASASNYGSLDHTDVRRLSFISFADVVQAEHSGGLGGSSVAGVASHRDSYPVAGLTSLNSVGLNRSSSPGRSPVSSAGGGLGTSLPASKAGSVMGFEISPSRKPLGSPSSGTQVSGELTIETMSQALQRTGSSDFSGVRSGPTSPV